MLCNRSKQLLQCCSRLYQCVEYVLDINFNQPLQAVVNIQNYKQNCNHLKLNGRLYHFSSANLTGGEVQEEQQPQKYQNKAENVCFHRACLSEDEILSELHSNKVFPSDTIAVKLAAYNSHVGAILGRDGVFARRYNKEHGITLTVTPRGVFFPGVRKRLVEFKGPAVKVLMAMAEAVVPVQEFRERFAAEAKESQKQSDLEECRRGFYITPFMPHKLVGYAIGERGVKLRELEKQYDVQIKVGNDQASLLYSRDRLMDIEGDPPNTLRALIAVIGLLQGGPTFQRFIDTNLLAHSECMWFFENNRMMDENKYFRSSIVEVSMPVPKKYYGMLMEQRGTAMRDIYDFSRAEINQHPAPPSSIEQDPHQTAIQIRGDFREVMRAMAMISSKLQAQEESDRYYFQPKS
eukprot:TRINITY_DN8844_c0_g2_i2.p1 TRINITY_DN8844_c0_g2~~TRINITY_DN8844_c0_g2_i2.p1  ORF type:complete len:406 (-),score=52.33 TRINITY_DN8844_c0_g2_i2:346-1563(-)